MIKQLIIRIPAQMFIQQQEPRVFARAVVVYLAWACVCFDQARDLWFVGGVLLPAAQVIIAQIHF